MSRDNIIYISANQYVSESSEYLCMEDDAKLVSVTAEMLTEFSTCKIFPVPLKQANLRIIVYQCGH
jgi:hypothetical protein